MQVPARHWFAPPQNAPSTSCDGAHVCPAEQVLGLQRLLLSQSAFVQHRSAGIHVPPHSFCPPAHLPLLALRRFRHRLLHFFLRFFLRFLASMNDTPARAPAAPVMEASRDRRELVKARRSASNWWPSTGGLQVRHSTR